MPLPAPLDEIVTFFERLPDDEKRGALISYAESSGQHEPRDGERFHFEDIRKDEECTDTVGIFLRIDGADRCRFRVTLGPKVQTLTKAMTSILCKGLDGASPRQILDLPGDFIPRIVGADLVRLRSRTIYYVLSRMKEAVQAHLARV